MKDANPSTAGRGAGFGNEAMARAKKDKRKGRNARSLAGIYEAHAGEVLTFVRSKVGDGPPDPDDIVHQAFANFAARDEDLRIGNPAAFLIQSARNLIFDHYKRAATRLHIDVEDHILEDVIGTHDEISPEIVVLGRERLDCVMAALKRLPPRQARFVLLARVEGLSYTEIARTENTSISTARREVEAGVRACIQALQEFMGDDED